MADVATPADKKAPPKFKQRAARTFKSKAPKPGQKGWDAFFILFLTSHVQLFFHNFVFLSAGFAHQSLLFLPIRFGDDIPGMEGLGTDFTVVCPWEAFGDMELSDLAKYGIV